MTRMVLISLVLAFLVGCVLAFVIATIPEPGINYGRPG